MFHALRQRQSHRDLQQARGIRQPAAARWQGQCQPPLGPANIPSLDLNADSEIKRRQMDDRLFPLFDRQRTEVVRPAPGRELLIIRAIIVSLLCADMAALMDEHDRHNQCLEVDAAWGKKHLMRRVELYFRTDRV